MRGRKNATASASAATFPGYANVAELASGAFATVYRAVELGTGRPVALKVLRVADASPHLVEVFEKELGALALLSNHPNVTTLYGTFSTPEGRPVLVLELCRESLAYRPAKTGPIGARGCPGRYQDRRGSRDSAPLRSAPPRHEAATHTRVSVRRARPG